MSKESLSIALFISLGSSWDELDQQNNATFLSVFWSKERLLFCLVNR